jgi:hypothetical protein
MRMLQIFVPLALAAGIAVPAFAQDVVLKVHHFWPPGAMPPSTILTPWCDKIARDSGNKMKCQIYPAMQLGGTPQNLIDQAKDGVVDIVWTLPGYTSGRYPMMEVFELPFMSSSAEATSQAVWDYYTQYGYKEFPGDQGARAERARQRLHPHQPEAGQGDGGLQGIADACADTADQQDARGAGCGAGRDAAARTIGGNFQGCGRRLSAAVGGHSVDQGA